MSSHSQSLGTLLLTRSRNGKRLMLDATVLPSILNRFPRVTDIDNAGCSTECCRRFYSNCNYFNCGRSTVSATTIQFPASADLAACLLHGASIWIRRCFVHIVDLVFFVVCIRHLHMQVHKNVGAINDVDVGSACDTSESSPEYSPGSAAPFRSSREV